MSKLGRLARGFLFRTIPAAAMLAPVRLREVRAAPLFGAHANDVSRETFPAGAAQDGPNPFGAPFRPGAAHI